MANNFKKQKEGMVENPTVSGVIADILIIVFLVVVMFVCFIPLWHVLMASISDGKSLLAHEGLLLKPIGGITLDGYRLAFSDSSIIMGYVNTIIYVVGATLVGLLINTTAGYVLSRQSKMKKLFTLFITFTMLFGGGLIPTYMVIRSIGMVGTRWALIIPGSTNAFFVIMMMNAFRSVPESTVEAARIDGAGHLRVVFRVMLPQCKSMTTVVILNSVVLQWNSWFNASIYIPNKRELWPLQLWIRQLVSDNEGLLKNANPDYSRYLIQYAVIIAASVPILLAMPFFQKKLETGTMAGAVKG